MENRSLLLVDDTDPRFSWSGNWVFKDTETKNNGYAPAYQGTLHRAFNVGESFSFTVESPYIAVWGTINSIREDAPRYQCTANGVNRSSSDLRIYGSTVNWRLLCLFDDLHQVSNIINITLLSIPNAEVPLSIDAVTYRPSTDATFSGTELVSHLDQRNISTTDTWDDYNDTESKFKAFPTKYSNGYSNISFSFEGTSVAMVGIVPEVGKLPWPEEQLVRGSAHYTIDDGSPTEFNIPALSSFNTDCMFPYVYFNKSDLPPGKHVVKVNETSDLSPLTFAYFEIVHPATNNSTGTGSSSGSGSGGDSTASNLPETGTSRSLSTAATAGVVIGALAAVGMLAATAFFLLRRRRAARQAANEKINLDLSNDDTGAPFLASPPTSAPVPYRDQLSPQSPPYNSTSEISAPSHTSNGDLRFGNDGSVTLSWYGAGSDAGSSSAPSAAPTGPAIAKVPAKETRYISHQDSGRRVVNAETEGPNIVDVPPEYEER